MLTVRKKKKKKKKWTQSKRKMTKSTPIIITATQDEQNHQLKCGSNKCSSWSERKKEKEKKGHFGSCFARQKPLRKSNSLAQK